MSEEMKGYRRYTIEELKLEDKDLQMSMTMGLVVGATYLDLLSLKNYIEKLPQFKLVYRTISTAHLRVVKIDEWEEFQEWKREKKEGKRI